MTAAYAPMKKSANGEERRPLRRGPGSQVVAI